MNSRRILTPISLILVSFFSLHTFAQVGVDFLPNEVLVSDPTQSRIVDAEYDSLLSRFCWIDNQHNLWIGKIDRNTGLFDPPDGRAQFVDSDALGAQDLGNGCEWVYSDTAPEIVYTKTDYSSRTARFLARAAQVTGGWIGGILDQADQRWAPIGSLDRNDVTPGIAYAGMKKGDAGNKPARVVYVRLLNDATSEQTIPTTDEFPTPGARWVPGTQSVIFTRPMPAGEVSARQVFKYDMDTQLLEQLTTDAGTKWSASMWQAPEYGGELVFLALIDETHIGIYRKIGGQWSLVHVIDPPAGDPPGSATYIWSPEPFVYRGKSYIFMTNSPSDNQQSFDIPTEIWLANVDPANQWYRRLSDDRQVVRKDPEYYVGKQGVYVFVNESGGVYRLDTGLQPR